MKNPGAHRRKHRPHRPGGLRQRTCGSCKGSGLLADTSDYSPAEREMLDWARCYECHGSGIVRRRVG